MSQNQAWERFLDSVCKRYEINGVYKELLKVLKQSHDKLGTFKKSALEELVITPNNFTKRMTTIYQKILVSDTPTGSENFPNRFISLKTKLNQEFKEEFVDYIIPTIFDTNVGISGIYENFPDDKFIEQLEKTIEASNTQLKKVDILQTFAPNLNNYEKQLINCVKNGVSIRILLAWPLSAAARLREDVLNKYKEEGSSEINIKNSVLQNLETLEKIVRTTGGKSKFLQIRLYDTIPSLAIYRADNYMLAGFFFHDQLAINTFQFEINLTAKNEIIIKTLKNEFNLMWELAKDFPPDLNWGSNWHNDWRISLEALFRREYY